MSDLKTKIAVLSNVNADFIARQLKKDFAVCPSIGYGDIWGHLLNTNSTLRQFEPKLIFIIVDINRLLESAFEPKDRMAIIDDWFGMAESATPTAFEYFISDVIFGGDISDLDEFDNDILENYWLEKLNELLSRHANIHRFSLKKIVTEFGAKNMFDAKMWYMGKLPFSHNGNVQLAAGIKNAIDCFTRVPKKVLVLDLDNTLWGGVLGEDGIEGIALGDDGVGAIYKDAQRLIKKMQQRGVMLAVSSKNNRSDVEELWRNHSHMLLRAEDFVSIKINWRDKVDNISEMARELNLGSASFVFLDDMEAERENVRMRLPEVVVADFPANVEQLPECLESIYERFFKKLRATTEDLTKTRQYLEEERRQAASQGMDYDTFLKSLNLRVKRVDFDEKSKNRIVQLINKTNQFNLTTHRRNLTEIERFLKDGGEIFAYQVSDKFGDYGIVAVILLDMRIPKIDTFLMSCRIMGKRLENFFIDRIENELLHEGFETLKAEYIASAKNMPVADFYDGLGYARCAESEGAVQYSIELQSRPVREFFVTNDGE